MSLPSPAPTLSRFLRTRVREAWLEVLVMVLVGVKQLRDVIWAGAEWVVACIGDRALPGRDCDEQRPAHRRCQSLGDSQRLALAGDPTTVDIGLLSRRRAGTPA